MSRQYMNSSSNRHQNIRGQAPTNAGAGAGGPGFGAGNPQGQRPLTTYSRYSYAQQHHYQNPHLAAEQQLARGARVSNVGMAYSGAPRDTSGGGGVRENPFKNPFINPDPASSFANRSKDAQGVGRSSKAPSSSSRVTDQKLQNIDQKFQEDDEQQEEREKQHQAEQEKLGQFYEGFHCKAHRFKFVEELKASVSTGVIADGGNMSAGSAEEEAAYKVAYCHFHGISEQTPSGLEQIDKVFSSNFNDSHMKPHALDMRCLYKGKHVKVVTPGGQEFVIPIEQEVIDVYAIENGLIFKTLYNQDEIHISLSKSKAFDKYINGDAPRKLEYTYFTITDHPLNEICPLQISYQDEFSQSIGSMLAIQIQQHIFCVSHVLPFVAMYDFEKKMLLFGVLKDVKVDDTGLMGEPGIGRVGFGEDIVMDQNLGGIGSGMSAVSGGLNGLKADQFLDNAYTQSLLPMSRHPLYQLSPKAPQLCFQQLWSIKCTVCPDEVALLSSGDLKSPFGQTSILTFYVFYKQDKQLAIINYDIETGRFYAEDVKKNVESVLMPFDFIKMPQGQNLKCVKSAYREIFAGVNQFDQQRINLDRRPNDEIRFLKKRASFLPRQVAFLDSTQPNCIQVYQKDQKLYEIPISEKEDNMNLKSISNLQGSKLTIEFESPLSKSKRISIQPLTFLNDSLTSNILKILARILPPQLFKGFYLEFLSKLKARNLSNFQSDFQLLSELLLSAVCGHEVNVRAFLDQSGASENDTSSQGKIFGKKKLGFIKSATISGTTNQTGPLGIGQKRNSELKPAQAFKSDKAYRKGKPFNQLMLSNFHLEYDQDDFDELFDNDTLRTTPKDVQDTQEDASSLKSSKRQPRKTQPLGSSKTPILQNNYTTTQAGGASSSALPSHLMHIKKFNNELLKIFHLLHEDMTLDHLQSSDAQRLAKLLCVWILNIEGGLQQPAVQGQDLQFSHIHMDVQMSNNAEIFKKVGYLHYYLNRYPELKLAFKNVKMNFESFFSEVLKDQSNILNGQYMIHKVPEISKILNQIKDGSPVTQPFTICFERTRKLVRIYQIMASTRPGGVADHFFKFAKWNNFEQPHQSNMLNPLKGIHCQSLDHFRISSSAPASKSQYFNPTTSQNRHEQLLFCLDQESISINDVAQMPQEVQKDLYEIFRFCKLNLEAIKSQSLEWTPNIYELINRKDLQNYMDTRKKAEDSSQIVVDSALQQLNVGGADHGGNANGSQQQESNGKKPHQTDFSTQSDHSQFVQFLIQRFSQDSRYKEVCNLLSSSKEMTLKISKINGFDTLNEEQQKEYKTKALEKIFKRHLSKMVGRGILNFGTKDTHSTEILSFLRINQTGYIPELNSSMTIELREENKEMLHWPNFHNGAAAAMTIAMSLAQQKHKEVNFIRNWIMQHRPATPKPHFAGFLLSNGLFGLLDTLTKTDIYQQLKSLHDSTTIAILLGKSASMIGSMDANFTKTLVMHITYLQSPNLQAEVSLPVQSAAVIGASLLFMGTSNRQVTEMLLAQIGRKPMNDKSIEREVYALSSGIGLGLVNLGAGQELQTRFSDLNIEDRLLRFIEGGKIMDLPKSMLQANQNIENQQCSSIREGSQVNVHITSSGALFALCLIHIQSNNLLISSKLQLPITFHQLESVRPAFLLEKVLCKNLILWDQIDASHEWLQNQIPQIIKFTYENDIQSTEQKYAQQLGGECIDFATISLCHANILTGACVSLGFKYAGTGNMKAFNLINDYVKKLKKAKLAVQMNSNILHQIYSDQTKNLIDKDTQANCMCMCALAMSLIMGGTGDAECFRTLRVIRKRLESEMHYGHNMAINMALGFLFLGSGAFTLGRNKFAVASLLCSLYPIFPKDPSDNRFHLQALRHFWVMAIESRFIQARDVDTGEFLQVQAILKTGFDQVRKVQTPALIDDDIQSIEFDDQRFYPLQVTVKQGLICANNNKNVQNNIQMGRNFEKIVYLKQRHLKDVAENLEQEGNEEGSALQVQRSSKLQHNISRQTLDFLGQIHKLLTSSKGNHSLTKSFFSKTLNFDLPQALDRLHQKPSSSASAVDYLQVFARQWSNQLIQKKLTINNKKCLNIILSNASKSSSSYDKHDIEDAAHHANQLFIKYQSPNAIKMQMQMLVGNNKQNQNDDLEQLHLALSTLLLSTNGQLQNPKNFNDATWQMQQMKIIQSLGVGSLFGDESNSSLLTPLQIQTCLIVISRFVDDLNQQGENKTVSEFKNLVVNSDFAQITSNAVYNEIFNAIASNVAYVMKQENPGLLDSVSENQKGSDYIKHVIMPGVMRLI